MNLSRTPSLVGVFPLICSPSSRFSHEGAFRPVNVRDSHFGRGVAAIVPLEMMKLVMPQNCPDVHDDAPLQLWCC